MAASSNQVTLPFDKLTESGLRPLIKKFAKWKCPVSAVDAPNQAKRESGSLVKTFTLTFEDGQKMLVRVKADGTVFQVKLNNKVMPIKHVDDMDKAIVEMVDYVQDNAKAYERAKIQREKKKLAPPPPPITTTRQKKISMAKSELENLTTANTDLEAQHTELASGLANTQSELAAATTSLEAEKEKNTMLESKITELQRMQGV